MKVTLVSSYFIEDSRKCNDYPISLIAVGLSISHYTRAKYSIMAFEIIYERVRISAKDFDLMSLIFRLNLYFYLKANPSPVSYTFYKLFPDSYKLSSSLEY